MIRPLLIGCTLLAVATSAHAQNDDQAVPPNVAKEPRWLAPADAEIQPDDYDTFSAWLQQRGPIPGIEAGGFLARELLGVELRAHSGETVGDIINLALNKSAEAEFLLVQLDGDDGMRAVPIDSIRVDREARFFTALTAAQIEALPRLGDAAG